MSRNILSVSPEATIIEAAELMTIVQSTVSWLLQTKDWFD
jgi:CBS domain-containing protein